MKLVSYLFFAILFLFSCSEDENSPQNPDCEFIGKWCQPSPFNPNECYELIGTYIEFRANGELLLVNTTTQRWESSDCKVIDVINTGTGMKAAEYKVVSLNGNQMTIDIGTNVDLIREN